MASAKEDSFDDLQKELKALRADLTALVGTVKEIGASQAENLASQVKGAVGELGSRMRMTADEARRRGEEAAHEIEDVIGRHPLTAVMVAMGVGFIVGAITRR
ncbi:MAG: DUF883 family protein [Bauldia sp.]|nr:DUF883 family protein [Bauldia sp.]